MLYRFRLACLACALVFSSMVQAESTIVTSVRPITLLVQEVTQGVPVSISTLLPQGATPHDYALKPSDLKRIHQADLVVWLGGQSEPYLKGVINKADEHIAWAGLAGLSTLPLRSALSDTGHDHHHDDHGHHHDDAFDMHFWMSVDNALLLADAVMASLIKQDASLQPTLAANVTKLKARLQQQVSQTSGLLTSAGPFLLAHDAYHYVEEDLGVHAEGAITLDPEIKPGVKHLMAIKQRLQDKSVRCVITDPSVSSALLDKVDTQPPVTRVAIDPLAWDYAGTEYAEWLASIYVKMAVCLTAR